MGRWREEVMGTQRDEEEEESYNEKYMGMREKGHFKK